MKSRKSAVSNSGPLIHLAKAGFLNILKELYSLVVPIEVTVEVVDKGKEKGYADAVQVENAIKSGWIEVVSVQLTREFSEAAEPDLDLAEVKVIYYACKNGITETISEDTADWRYVSIAGVEKKISAEIAREIAKEIEEVEICLRSEK